LFLAVIISVAAIVADSRFGVFSHVRVYLSSLVSPLQYIANAPGTLLDTMSTQVQTRADLIEQTKQQEQQLFTLRSRLLKMDQLEHENQRLRELLGSPVHKESRKMVAELLSVDSDPFSHQVLINKGALDGVYNGQPVINDQHGGPQWRHAVCAHSLRAAGGRGRKPHAAGAQRNPEPAAAAGTCACAQGQIPPQTWK
jgi:rod shape-determining protein MreC